MQRPISTPAAAAAIFIFKSNFSIPRIFFPFFFFFFLRSRMEIIHQ
jgi:hypothetical protein